MRAYLARVDAVLVQAVIAAALSFAHLHDLASAAGQDGWKAWAYPVSVDLLLVAAWKRLRSGASKAAGWCWFVVALAASLGANVATAGLLDLADGTGCASSSPDGLLSPSSAARSSPTPHQRPKPRRSRPNLPKPRRSRPSRKARGLSPIRSLSHSGLRRTFRPRS
ncbi:DUF2637 domain-containing protein [Stenotrophomonas sp. NPDC087984]